MRERSNTQLLLETPDVQTVPPHPTFGCVRFRCVVARLKLTGDEDGSGTLPSSSCARISSREGMVRARMVVGSCHLALQEELGETARRPPDCQLTLLSTTLPALTVASGVVGMDVDVDALVVVFVF